MMARSIQNVVITKDQCEQFCPFMTDKEISVRPTMIDVGVQSTELDAPWNKIENSKHNAFPIFTNMDLDRYKDITQFEVL